MKYGEKYRSVLVNRFTKEHIPYTTTYKYTEWHEYHTNREGDGLWHNDKQILGTCQFTVAGCKTEKAAKAKIRRWVTAE